MPARLPGDIEELQLDHNRIEALRDEALGYPRLRRLSVACNRLRRLQANTFRDSKLLQSLNFARNRLYADPRESGRALKTLPGLRFLDLSENFLDEDMAAALLQNLTSLEHLDLSGNLLKRLDGSSFGDLLRLKELDLQGNVIFELDGAFDGTPQLQRLNLAFNHLPCLYDFHMSRLVVLNASFNAIEWFISGPELNETFQLETLDLSHNRLLFFPFLPGRSRLRELYLSHNSLRFYEPPASGAAEPNLTTTVEFYNVNRDGKNLTVRLWDEGLHGDISSVEVLDLRGNQVERFPAGFLQKMPALQRLHLRANCLETLNLTSERISGSLYELDVSNNRLSRLLADEGAAAALGNLAHLNLSLNRLRRLPAGLFSWMPSLWSVDLSYNGVGVCLPGEANASAGALSACVDWTASASLRQLYLRGCGLKAVPSAAFGRLPLTHLELSDNPGLVVLGSTRSLPGTLQHLGLGNTGLRDPDVSGFRRLTFLNISGNGLSQLPPSLLDLDLDLKGLVLDLRDNRLSALPAQQARALAAKLQRVFLAGNPFNCCQMEWLRALEAVSVVGRSELECEDLFLRTHRVDRADSFACVPQGGESAAWYVLLFLPVFLSLLGVLAIVLQTFRPKVPQSSSHKKSLKPTSY